MKRGLMWAQTFISKVGGGGRIGLVAKALAGVTVPTFVIKHKDTSGGSWRKDIQIGNKEEKANFLYFLKSSPLYNCIRPKLSSFCVSRSSIDKTDNAETVPFFAKLATTGFVVIQKREENND